MPLQMRLPESRHVENQWSRSFGLQVTLQVGPLLTCRTDQARTQRWEDFNGLDCSVIGREGRWMAFSPVFGAKDGAVVP